MLSVDIGTGIYKFMLLDIVEQNFHLVRDTLCDLKSGL